MQTGRNSSPFFVLGLMLSVCLTSGDAWGRDFKATVAGASVSTAIDTNGDGAPAALLTAAGQSSLGPLRIQSLTEFQVDLQDPTDPTSVVPCLLSDGSPGVQLRQLMGRGAYQVSKGDLFFISTVEGTGCLNAATCFDATGQIVAGCTFSTHHQIDIVGGTGAFAGAHGSFEAQGIGEFLLSDPSGSFTVGTFEAIGKIHLR